MSWNILQILDYINTFCPGSIFGRSYSSHTSFQVESLTTLLDKAPGPAPEVQNGLSLRPLNSKPALQGKPGMLIIACAWLVPNTAL